MCSFKQLQLIANLNIYYNYICCMIKNLFIIAVFLIITGRVVAQHDTIALNEVEIIDSRNRIIFSPVDQISSVSIGQSSASDAGALLSKAPNVSGIRKGVNGYDPVVRSFKYSQLNILLNGTTKIEGGCPNRMDPATTHIDPNEITQISIYKGPYALKFGPSFGGVINITTWKPVFTEKLITHITGIVGMQSNGVGYNSNIKLKGTKKKISYEITAGTKKYNSYSDGDGRWVNAGMQHLHATAKAGLKTGSNSIIDVRVDYSEGKNIAFPALSMDERKDQSTIYNLNYKTEKLSNTINFIKLKGWLSLVNHNMDNKNRPFSDTVVAVSTIAARDAGLRGALSINVAKGLLETGFDFEHIDKDGLRSKWMIKQPGLPIKNESVWSNAIINNLGVYAQYIYTQSNIDWVLAGRIDFNNAASDPMIRMGMNNMPWYKNENMSSSYTNFSYNGGIFWKLNDNNTLSFSAGRGVRSPDMTERFIVLLPVGYDKYDYLGNPQLKPEANNEIDVSLKHVTASIMRFKGNIFFSYVTNFIGSRKVSPSFVRPQTKGVLGVKQFVNFEKVWLTGFEFSLVSSPQKLWQLNINAAYTYGINPQAFGYKIEHGQVVNEYTIYNDPLPEIPPFEADLSFKYKYLDAKIVPSISWRIVASQKAISQSYGEQISYAFQIFDLKLKYVFSTNLIIKGGVNNVFNKTYFEHLNRNIIGSSEPLYEPGRNFFVNLIFSF